MRKKRSRVWCGLASMGAVFAVVTAIAGCDHAVNPAVTACEDYANAWATRASECGADYQAQKAQLEALLGCGTITSIRDRMSLYDTCFPWIESLTCAQLDDKNLVVDPSCAMQLQR